MSLGIARRCVEVMNTYAKERKSFGKPLNSFGQIQKHIADSYAEYMAGKAYVYGLSNSLALDSDGNRLDSDGVKLYASVMGKNVADRAIKSLVDTDTSVSTMWNAFGEMPNSWKLVVAHSRLTKEHDKRALALRASGLDCQTIFSRLKSRHARLSRLNQMKPTIMGMALVVPHFEDIIEGDLPNDYGSSTQASGNRDDQPCPDLLYCMRKRQRSRAKRQHRRNRRRYHW